MSHRRLLELRISQAPLFLGLPKEDRLSLIDHAATHRFEAGETVVYDDSLPDSIFILLSGSVNIARTVVEGTTTVLRRLFPPTIFGYCVLSGRPYSADVIASDTSLTASFPLAVVKPMLLKQPETLFTVINHLSSLVDNLTTEKIELKVTQLESRIVHVLEGLADVEGVCLITHERLGQMAGGSRSNVSRALSNLKHAGLVELGRRKIVITK